LKSGRGDLALADFKRACELGDEGGCYLAHQLSRGLQ
jgi:hypothetical protein